MLYKLKKVITISLHRPDRAAKTEREKSQRERSLRPRISNKLTEPGFCFQEILEITKHLAEIMQLTPVTQLSLL